MRGKLVFFAGMAAALAAGWAGFPYALYERRPQPLQFNHAVHMGDKGSMKCEDCHALRDDGSFAGIPALEKCSGCHAQPLGQTQAEKVLVEKYVTPNREIPWEVYSRQPENVWFPHSPHIKLAKLACAECHGDHGKTTSLRPFERNRAERVQPRYLGAVNFAHRDRQATPGDEDGRLRGLPPREGPDPQLHGVP